MVIDIAIHSSKSSDLALNTSTKSAGSDFGAIIE